MSGPSSDPSTRATLLGALSIVVAFLAGLGTATLLSEPSAQEPTTEEPAPALFEDLDLTADQRAVVDSVLSATRASTARTLDETRMELTAQAVEAIRAIEAVLSPAQIETLKARMDARKADLGVSGTDETNEANEAREATGAKKAGEANPGNGNEAARK